jgi:hypothetical protein
MTVTATILLISIMQWLSKSLTMTELFTGEQMMFIILSASSTPFLWHLTRKATPYVIERVMSRRGGMEVKAATRPAEAPPTVEPEPEAPTPSREPASELQAGPLSQISGLREKLQEVGTRYGHEVRMEGGGGEPALHVEAEAPPIAPKPIMPEPRQASEDYSLELTEEELRELRELAKRIRELRRKLLAYM